MPASLPNPEPHDEKLAAPCAAGCKRRVIRARDDAGRIVFLEWCPAGAGTHTITAGLFPGTEPTATASKGKNFRIHDCTEGAVVFGRQLSQEGAAGLSFDASAAPPAASTLAENRRGLLSWAALLVEGCNNPLHVASTLLRLVNPRHPLYYRANQLLRQLDELRVELRREAGR
jgi:hypothetical protein